MRMKISPNRRDQKHSYDCFRQSQHRMLKLPTHEAHDLHPSCSEERSVNPRRSCHLMPQLDQVDLPSERVRPPWGPMFDCAWWLIGPASMSVGIFGKMPCGKCSGDFLRLLLKRRFIVVPGKRERAKVMDPQSRIVALGDKHKLRPVAATLGGGCV